MTPILDYVFLVSYHNCYSFFLNYRHHKSHLPICKGCDVIFVRPFVFFCQPINVLLFLFNHIVSGGEGALHGRNLFVRKIFEINCFTQEHLRAHNKNLGRSRGSHLQAGICYKVSIFPNALIFKAKLFVNSNTINSLGKHSSFLAVIMTIVCKTNISDHSTTLSRSKPTVITARATIWNNKISFEAWYKFHSLFLMVTSSQTSRHLLKRIF